jgi:hypothetical protein
MNGFQNNFTALPIIITTDSVYILSEINNLIVINRLVNTFVYHQSRILKT